MAGGGSYIPLEPSVREGSRDMVDDKRVQDFRRRKIPKAVSPKSNRCLSGPLILGR